MSSSTLRVRAPSLSSAIGRSNKNCAEVTEAARVLNFRLAKSSSINDLIGLVHGNGDSLDSVNAATLFRQAAKLGASPGHFQREPLRRIVEMLPHLLQEAKPRAVTDTVWSFAVLRIKDVEFMQTVVKPDQFAPRDLATTAWAFATLKCVNPALHAAISSRARRILPQFTAIDLASFAWSLAVVA